MVSKKKRQQKMLEIICDQKIYTQEQLTVELEKANYYTTQATISRDMKELGIHKESDSNSKSRYIAPIAMATRNGLKICYHKQILHVDYVNNILVLRGTKESLVETARHLEKEMEEIVGKVMDDTTMFILCREAAGAEELIRYFVRKDNAK